MMTIAMKMNQTRRIATQGHLEKFQGPCTSFCRAILGSTVGNHVRASIPSDLAEIWK
jgi:hypothetical protein